MLLYCCYYYYAGISGGGEACKTGFVLYVIECVCACISNMIINFLQTLNYIGNSSSSASSSSSYTGMGAPVKTGFVLYVIEYACVHTCISNMLLLTFYIH